MIIEKLSEKDVEVIRSLQSGFCDGWSENQLKSAFESGRFIVYSAKEGEEYTGFVSISTTIDDCDVETVFVKPEHRRRGVAKALIEHAQAQMVGQGIRKIFLEVRESNAPAKSLYSALGYKEISVRKNYYSDGENAVVMAKELL